MAKDETAPLEECPYADCDSTDFTSQEWDGTTNTVRCSEGHTVHVEHDD